MPRDLGYVLQHLEIAQLFRELGTGQFRAGKAGRQQPYDAAKLGAPQVRLPEICAADIHVAEVEPGEVRHDLRVIAAPSVPRHHAILQLVDVGFDSHPLSAIKSGTGLDHPSRMLGRSRRLLRAHRQQNLTLVIHSVIEAPPLSSSRVFWPQYAA